MVAQNVGHIVLSVSLLVIVLFAANLLLNLFTRHNKHVEVPDFMNMTLDEALAASREDKLRIEVNDSLYVPAFDPGVILEQRPAAGTEVKPGRRIYVTVNSSQQRMIDVPYVAGYSLRQAKNILETAGLEIEKLVYVDDIATNNVLEQRVGPEVVAADNRVQARVGSGVVLTVGRAPGADLVSVPRVVGLPLREAKSRIWEAGLNVAGVTLAEDIDRMNLRQARVYLQQPDQGHRVVLGTGISIALSLDSSKSLSPLLRVGDRVNVMAVVSDGATSSAETVCANVKIIALDSALSGSPDAGYSLVTLDVTEDQAAAIVANPNVTLTAIPQTAEGASDAE